MFEISRSLFSFLINFPHSTLKMAQYTVRDLIEVVYSDGKNTCFKLTEHTTAWVEDGLLGKRFILAWKVARDEEGLYEAVKSKGVILHWHELDDLKDRIDDGSFGRAVELACIRCEGLEDHAQRVHLDESVLEHKELSSVWYDGDIQ